MANALFLLQIKSFHLNVVKKQTHGGTQPKDIGCWFCVSNWRASHPLLVFVAYDMASNYFSSTSLSVTRRDKAGTELCQGNTVIKVTSSLDFKFLMRWKKWCHCLKSSPDLFFNLPTWRRSRLSDSTPKTPQLCVLRHSGLSAKSVRHFLGTSVATRLFLLSRGISDAKWKITDWFKWLLNDWYKAGLYQYPHSPLVWMKLYRLLEMNMLQE